MRVLVISFYYPPDLGPAALRAKSIKVALEEIGGPRCTVELLTTFPHRYATVRSLSTMLDISDVSIKRIKVPKHNNGILDQSISFLFFLILVIKTVRTQKYDVVFVTSSKLMTASAGVLISRLTGAKLILDIRDLFCEVLKTLYPKYLLFFCLPVFKLLERFTFRASDSINVVSPGFIEYVRNIAPEVPLTCVPNGIDQEFLEYNFQKPIKSPKPIVLYAGNIGDGQRLDGILPEVAKSLEKFYEFIAIGSGGRIRNLEEEVKRLHVSNLKILEPVERKNLFELYRHVDILFLHLNSGAAFEDVLPSKIFEYAATGKPIIAGVNGEARKFLQAEVVDGVWVFDPFDRASMIRSLADADVNSDYYPRTQFLERFSRKTLISDFVNDALDTVVEQSEDF